MLALIAAMLAGGAKGFFEDPAYLIGVPLLALGVIGLLLVISPLGRAQPRHEDKSGDPEAGKGRSAAEHR